MTPEQIEQAASRFEEIPTVKAGKRCGVQWTPWMGDWFTSWSPRNGNNNAEGQWDHWIDLAIGILQDPMTAIVRPDVHEAAKQFGAHGFYDEAGRELSDDELRDRFTAGGES